MRPDELRRMFFSFSLGLDLYLAHFPTIFFLSFPFTVHSILFHLILLQFILWLTDYFGLFFIRFLSFIIFVEEKLKRITFDRKRECKMKRTSPFTHTCTVNSIIIFRLLLAVKKNQKKKKVNLGFRIINFHF